MFNLKELIRTVNLVAGLIPPGADVTVEATPLYAGQPWDGTHEFGYNRVLRLQAAALRDRGHKVSHVAMVDDYTTGKTENPDVFLRKMRNRPDRVYSESQFREPAEAHLKQLRAARRVVAYSGELRLSGGSQPRLTVKSGRVSCELLDACMQRAKGAGSHVIIHPTEFVPQQLGMREILQAINGGELFGQIINIFFKGRSNAISRILITDRDGRTRNV